MYKIVFVRDNDVADPDKEPVADMPFTLHKPHLELLWQYTCRVTKGRPANCMTWNKSNLVNYIFNDLCNVLASTQFDKTHAHTHTHTHTHTLLLLR